MGRLAIVRREGEKESLPDRNLEPMRDHLNEPRGIQPPRNSASSGSAGELVTPGGRHGAFEDPTSVVVLSDQPAWSHADATCRRVILAREDCAIVVFVSDANSEGRSITNVFKELCDASRRDAVLPTPSGAEVLASKIRWFECRTGEVTKGGVRQSLSFDEFFEASQDSQAWKPARDAFSVEVARALNIQAVTDLVMGLRSE